MEIVDILPSTSQEISGAHDPVCVIVLGMAGSGKTALVQRVAADLSQNDSPPYVVNLDPAITKLPYPAHIDIRDTVRYKEVMTQYNLGPNGGIMTSLNLFTTRFDQVLKVIEKRKNEHKYIIFDSPGQIEVFTWSASGSIITETLAAVYPTVIIYVMDIARSVSPVTFMSNMLYACSILYRTRLPFIVVMNKADIVEATFAMDWMKDFEAFGDALESDASYMVDLTRSLSLVLDEFYAGLRCISFSALLGTGLEDLYKAISNAKGEYYSDYLPEYERLKRKKEKEMIKQQTKQLEQVKIDMGSDKREGSKLAFRGSEQIQGQRVFIGTTETEDDDSDERMSNEDEDDPPQEVESFKRFLAGHQQEKEDSDVPNKMT